MPFEPVSRNSDAPFGAGFLSGDRGSHYSPNDRPLILFFQKSVAHRGRMEWASFGGSWRRLPHLDEAHSLRPMNTRYE